MVRRIVAGAVVALMALAGCGFFVVLVTRSREAAARVRCFNNLRGLGLALTDFAQKNQTFPPGSSPPQLPVGDRVSWIPLSVPAGQKFLLPAGDYGPDRGWRWDGYDSVRDVQPVILRCPGFADDSSAVTDYVGSAGVGADAPLKRVDVRGAGLFRHTGPTPLAAVTDGTSTTMALLETGTDLGPWLAGGRSTVRPLDPATRPYLGLGRPFGGGHAGGAQVGLADGGARFLSNRTDPAVLELLAGVADGERAQPGDD